jgi:hypothetical protein
MTNSGEVGTVRSGWGRDILTVFSPIVNEIC